MTDSHVYSFKDLIGLPPEEYTVKANEKVDLIIGAEIKRNIARNGLYSLYFILDEISQGRDSYTIVEALKWFFYQMAKGDPEIAQLAELRMEEHEKYIKETMEKIKPGD